MDDDESKPATAGPSIQDFKATHTEAATLTIINELRDKFAGHVIRRTGASKDDSGMPLAGIAPAREHVMMLDLYPGEYAFLDSITEGHRNSDGSLVKMTQKVSSFF